MIAFVTLFLGLVTGVQTVEVAAAGQVASVELRLDGRPVGRLDGEPWRARVDFGDELTTHELVAVARDAGGAEVGRASQQVNVPRSSIETEILLDGWRGERPGFARLIWRSAELVEPETIAVALDNEAVPVVDPGRIELPPMDPRTLHFISAELTFPGNRRVSAQSVFGGRYGVEVETELTAVPVLPTGGRLKSAEDARGWLRRRGGGELRVVAVEDDVAEVLVVRDDVALRSLQRLARTVRRERPRSYRLVGLAAEDRLFLMSARPVVAAHPETDYELYPVSRPLGVDEASLPEALAALALSDAAKSPQRLADAVAVAGVRAAAGGRRRAVLLVVSDCARQSGRWSGEEVRRYLAELRVPLVVWATRSPDRAPGGFCAGAVRLKGTGSYLSALASLRRRLERQQVLWVEGRHLPREIVLAEGAPVTDVVAKERSAG